MRPEDRGADHPSAGRSLPVPVHRGAKGCDGAAEPRGGFVGGGWRGEPVRDLPGDAQYVAAGVSGTPSYGGP